MTKKYIFRRLLKKAISMALWTKVITCYKAGFKSRFCQVHQAGKIGVNQRNLRLINDLRLRKITYEKINLFMQNKANFLDDQINVSHFITTNYEQRTMNYEGKNKANSKPIQTQYKPNTNPIRTQFKPKQTQNKPNYSSLQTAKFTQFHIKEL